VRCVCCRESDFVPVAGTCRDTDRYSVVRCRACGLTQLSPTPNESEHEEFHDLDLQSESILDTNDVDLVVARKVWDTERRVAFIQERFSESAAVLDVGSGYGVLLGQLARCGYRVTGVEPSAARRAVSRQITDAPTVSAGLPSLPMSLGRFDAILLIHVLEHLVDPVEALTSVNKLMEQGGSLVIEVPNVDDLLVEGSDAFRNFYWQRAHVSYFSAATLKSVLLRAGFATVAVEGVQRYGLENLMTWHATGRPQLPEPSFQTTGPYRWLEDLYKRQLEQSLRCDTLVAVARV
jgi:2-polyprenyl-3-methyl-5-hydroxy-6-metoxy-1,4-benzoquinol methylase